MQDLPKPATGSELVALRKSLGVAQQDLARALGVHRITLNKWEGADQVDAIRTARYQRALADLTRQAIA